MSNYLHRAVTAFLVGMLFGWMIITLSAVFARAQEHPHTHAGEVGRFYQTWNRPYAIEGACERRECSCCSQQDCAVRPTKLVGGTWFVFYEGNGEWLPIPEERWEHNQPDPKESPDGLTHTCIAGNTVLCATQGGGM